VIVPGLGEGFESVVVGVAGVCTVTAASFPNYICQFLVKRVGNSPIKFYSWILERDFNVLFPHDFTHWFRILYSSGRFHGRLHWS